MPSNSSIKSEAQQNTTPQNTSQQDNKLTVSVTEDTSVNMGDNKVITEAEMMAMGEEISKSLVSASGMSSEAVKSYKAKIYNVFTGKSQPLVDMTVVAYFCVNDPSPRTNWAKAPPIVVGGVAVPIVKVVGPIIPVAQGDGILRKFLSTGYENIVPMVIKSVPGVAEILNARLASQGMFGMDPIVAVSWVKGTSVATASSSNARGLFRGRATRGTTDVLPESALEAAPPQAPVSEPVGRYF